MEKKYKLAEETINVGDKTLYRIEALKDFSDVKKGDKGGYIEKEENLSQNGNCWVYDDAVVYGTARVYDNAKVYDYAKVYHNAVVYGNAEVFNNAQVFGNAKVYDYAKVCYYAKVCDNAQVYCNALVIDNARVYSNAKVYGNAEVYGNAVVDDNAQVYDNANVYEDAEVFGNAEIRGDAVITSKSDYIVFKNWWSSGRYFTWTRSNNMWKVGCFYGTGEELIDKAYKDSKLSGREYERVVKYIESILKDNNTDV